jgi:hypothetical protein
MSYVVVCTSTDNALDSKGPSVSHNTNTSSSSSVPDISSSFIQLNPNAPTFVLNNNDPMNYYFEECANCECCQGYINQCSCYEAYGYPQCGCCYQPDDAYIDGEYYDDRLNEEDYQNLNDIDAVSTVI